MKKNFQKILTVALTLILLVCGFSTAKISKADSIVHLTLTVPNGYTGSWSYNYTNRFSPDLPICTATGDYNCYDNQSFPNMQRFTNVNNPSDVANAYAYAMWDGSGLSVQLADGGFTNDSTYLETVVVNGLEVADLTLTVGNGGTPPPPPPLVLPTTPAETSTCLTVNNWGYLFPSQPQTADYGGTVLAIPFAEGGQYAPRVPYQLYLTAYNSYCGSIGTWDFKSAISESGMSYSATYNYTVAIDTSANTATFVVNGVPQTCADCVQNIPSSFMGSSTGISWAMSGNIDGNGSGFFTNSYLMAIAPPPYRQMTVKVAQGSNTTGTFGTGAPITISGNCPVMGAESNAIAIIEGIANPDHMPTSADYQYSCDSNGQYSVDLNPSVGSHNYFVFYEQYANDPTNPYFLVQTSIVQIVLPQDGWQFVSEYPTIANQSVRVQPASPFPFEWAYKLPSDTMPSDVYFLLVSFANNTYTNPTFVYESPLSTLDPTGNKSFSDSHVNATNNVLYYSARLCTGTWDSSVPTLCALGAYKNFAIVGETDSTLPPPVLPDQSGLCTNILCSLFIPPQDFWTSFLSQTQNNFQNTIPFYYFYQLKDSFTEVSTTRQDGYFIDTTLTLPHSNISIPFQFFNTADPTIKSVFDDFRPYISAGLWLGFALYLVTRAYSLLTPE